MVPSPTDLLYFVEVANLLNLSRAAECLGISQPSLTLAMQRLETCIGVPLLNRHKRGVSLTKAGKQLLVHTRQLIQQWDSIKSETLSSMHAVQGSFTLGCHTSVALYSLPLFLADLLEKNPKLEIKLKHDASRKITEQVINLAIDVGIVVNPVKHPDLIIKKLADDKISLWQGKTSNQIQNIHSDRTLLICDPDLLQTQAILKKLKKQNIHYTQLITTNSLEVAADLAKSGAGIAILPGRVAETRDLIPVPRSPVHADEVCLLYRGEHRSIKAIQVITQAIKNAF